jgi:hypothetical protein
MLAAHIGTMRKLLLLLLLLPTSRHPACHTSQINRSFTLNIPVELQPHAIKPWLLLPCQTSPPLLLRAAPWGAAGPPP